LFWLTVGDNEKLFYIVVRSINLLHLPFYMSTVFEFVRAFLSQKIKNRIVTLNDDKKLTARYGFAGYLIGDNLKVVWLNFQLLVEQVTSCDCHTANIWSWEFGRDL